MTKAATVFISYLSHTANELTVKKTIGPNDVIAAIRETEFEKFLPRLERELDAYATVVAGKRKGYRMKVKERESMGGKAEEGEEAANGAEGEEGDDSERGAKRQRMNGDGEGRGGEDSRLVNGGSISGTSGSGRNGISQTGYDGGAEASEGDTLEDEAGLEEELEEADEEVGDETQDEEEDDEDQDDVDDGYGPGAQLRAAMEDVDDTGEESD
jgi:DNA polymerase epsilon subunit 3